MINRINNRTNKTELKTADDFFVFTLTFTGGFSIINGDIMLKAVREIAALDNTF